MGKKKDKTKTKYALHAHGFTGMLNSVQYLRNTEEEIREVARQRYRLWKDKERALEHFNSVYTIVKLEITELQCTSLTKK